MPRDNVSVSVIMPALNEEIAIAGAVESVLASFEKFNIDGEIVVVNDGSVDATHDIVISLIESSKGKIRIIDHDSPKGVGRSFFEGAKIAKKDVVVLSPGDNENDPDEILQYVDLFNYVDVVNPFIFNPGVRDAFRQRASLVFTAIMNATFRASFKYTNGAAMYRREVLAQISCRSNGFLYLTEILVKLSRKGYLFAEVPCALGKRAGGASKAVSFKTLKQIAIDCIKLVRDIYFSEEYKPYKSRPIASSVSNRRLKRAS